MTDTAVRTAEVRRTTGETDITVRLNLDESAEPSISTGLGFLDHMLTLLAFHARIGLALKAEGDLDVDDHHTVEDCALALGQAVDEALGDRKGIARYGYAYAPMDEALARAVLDFSRRPVAVVNLNLLREKLGDVACENLTHFFQSLASASGLTLHLDVLRGENEHHKVEAAFKAFALAFRQAVNRSGENTPSTKGTL